MYLEASLGAMHDKGYGVAPITQKPTDVSANAVYFAGAPTAGIIASGPSPYFRTKSAKTLTLRRAS